MTKLLFPFLALACTLTAAPPNFLFLLSDDQAWSGLSCEMHPDLPQSRHRVIETPHIARLAGQGMRFSAAYAPAPVCSPTRISLQTGRNPAALHWTKAAPAETGFALTEAATRKSIQPEEVTLGQLLQGAGYATAHYGKWHLAGRGPEAHGYDESDGATGNHDAAPHLPPNPVDIFGMGSRATAFMRNSQAAGKPFFIQLSYHALHYPENATPALLKKYRQLLPGGNEKEIGRAAISEDLDAGVGELLASLDELGLSANTYVIYMSDNGGANRQGLRGGKGDLWEGGIRVPLIIRGPDIPPNSWCHERVVGYDLFPSICKLSGMGITLPSNLDGGDLSHLLLGGSQPVRRPRDDLVFHFPHYQGDTPHSAILSGNHKLLHFYETDQRLLFNIKTDIREQTNLASSQPELTARLSKQLTDYLTEVRAQMPTPNPNATRTAPAKAKTKGKGSSSRRPKAAWRPLDGVPLLSALPGCRCAAFLPG